MRTDCQFPCPLCGKPLSSWDGFIPCETCEAAVRESSSSESSEEELAQLEE